MNQTMLPTKFAPAERATSEAIAADFQQFFEMKDVGAFVNALPYVACVLNEERQIVYANEALLGMLGVEEPEAYLGNRLGEQFACQHAWEEPGGCGTSEYCRYCGAVQAMVQSQQLECKVEKECRFMAESGGELKAMDFRVTTSPFHYGGHRYLILSLVDISSEKRRDALERIFFHDIINTAGSLSGLLEILKDAESLEEIQDYLSLADGVSRHLVDEILAQRQLLAAEKGELELERKVIFSKEVVHDSIRAIMQHPVAEGRTLLISPDSHEATLHTDPVLLSRVLINMLKNALEATPQGGVVRIGCHLRKGKPIFWVHNERVMDLKTQRQIFMRSFSTKGKNRGLGTYSMKLLGENYLGGKVSFVSKEGEGTTFCLELPPGGR
ncbi:MAG: GHKL domain-containing protein [Bacteroidetes bacterium]|nr:MAG: GHKL domain-containing protein [Bacteroidota bacterium]